MVGEFDVIFNRHYKKFSMDLTWNWVQVLSSLTLLLAETPAILRPGETWSTWLTAETCISWWADTLLNIKVQTLASVAEKNKLIKVYEISLY